MIVMRALLIILMALTVHAQEEKDLHGKSKIAFSPHNFIGSSVITGSDSTLHDFILCRQCHTPSKMSSVEPLWDRSALQDRFDFERSIEKQTGDIAPTDIKSRSCLYCHDGSLASGFTPDQKIAKQQVALLAPQEKPIKNLNMHLFTFPEHDMETHKPGAESPLPLDETNMVSCVSCHDPHNNDRGNFLRVGKSQLCLECHTMPNWNLSTHGNPDDPRFANLNDSACASCHNIHEVQSAKNLLLADENSLCLSCHDGNQDAGREIVSEFDLEAVFEKPYNHPIRLSTISGAEKTLDAWSSGIAADRSVACSDCHNPHAASAESSAPFLDGSQQFVSGVDSHGFTKDVSDYEYETCYKCHGMNQNAGLGQEVGRLLAKTNMSYHPIEAPGNNPYVPSLKAEWSEQSMLQCSDCHGNDDPLGPQGPHGSNIPHLLKAEYADYPFAGLDENQLCFRCHEEQRVVQSNGFKYHQLHIQDAGYACSACHDPHGSIEYPGLIDLSAGFIEPLNGVLELVQTEPGHGYCTLKCHDKAHPSQSF